LVFKTSKILYLKQANFNPNFKGKAAIFMLNMPPRILKYQLAIYLILISTVAARAQTDSVKIYLGWFHQFQFAGYYASQEKGFFEEEGLQVHLQRFDGTIGIQPILEGKYEYGVATAGQLMGSSGRDSLVVIAPIFQQSPLALMVERDSGIRTLKDLEGKTVGVGSELKTMMYFAGVNMSKVNFIQPTSYISDLKAGIADAITHYVIDSIKTSDYLLFRPIEYGVNFYGECLYTHQSELDENPERVEKIHRAVLKGWKYAADHREELIDIILSKYNPDMGREGLAYEAESVINSHILNSFYPVGFNDMDRWIHMERTLSTQLTFDQSIDWNRFIYRPDVILQEQVIQKIIRYAWIVGVLALLTLFALFVYNRQLQRAVRSSTIELEAQKSELSQLNVFKDKMLSIISHDLRGPMSSVQSLIDLTVTQGISGDDFKKVMVSSRTKIHEINAFIDNILYWAKNQLTGINLKPERLNLKEIVDSSVKLTSLAADEKNILIDTDVNKDLYVHADLETTKLIIRNLLTNAVKFCDKEDKITVYAQKKNDDVHISVKDTGPGIEPGLIEVLFSAEQVSKKGSRDESGSGLGLILCKEFVEENGGVIKAESQLGKGSVFTFTLPSAS
jgi:signal transduction histidine kinase